MQQRCISLALEPATANCLACSPWKKAPTWSHANCLNLRRSADVRTAPESSSATHCAATTCTPCLRAKHASNASHETLPTTPTLH
eukprot:15456402-Alexandrium_andersonii.AAC.1